MFDVTLEPGNLFAAELNLDYPASGAVATGTVTVAGDARAMRAMTGITLTLSGRTYGPFASLGDYDWDPRTNHTVLYLAEQRPTEVIAAGLGSGTVASTLAILFPGVDLTAVPTVLKNAALDASGFNGKERRAVFTSLLGGLGFRLIEEQGAFKVAAPAHEDQHGLTFSGGAERGDINASPSRIVVTGGTTALIGDPGGVGPIPSATLSSGNPQITWSGVGESFERVRAYVVQHSTDGNVYTDLAQVKATGASSYSYTHTGAGAGTHWYRLVSLRASGSDAAAALIRTQPGVTVQVGTGSVPVITPGVSSLIIALSGNAASTRVTVNGVSGDFMGTFKAGSGLALNVALNPASSYTVTFADPANGTVRYPAQTVTTVAAPTMNPEVTATGDGAFVTYSGSGTYLWTVKQGAATVQQARVSGGQFSITGLMSQTAYVFTIEPEDVPAQRVTQNFTTLEADQQLSDQELFALSLNGTYSETVPIGGGSQTTTWERADGRMKQIIISRTASVPATVTTADGQTTEMQTVNTTTTTVPEYAFPDWPKFETGSTTSTVSTGPRGSTRTRVAVRKEVADTGRVTSRTTRTQTWQTLSGQPERQILDETLVLSWARSGLTSWVRSKARTGFTSVLDGETWVELPISDINPADGNDEPERVPADERTVLPDSMGDRDPDAPPVWDAPPAVPDAPIGTQITSAPPEQAITVTRAGQGYAAPLQVDMTWTTDLGVLNYAADFAAEHLGGLQVSVTRTYAYPYGARRGGAVQGVQIKLAPGAFSETVQTRYAP